MPLSAAQQAVLNRGTRGSIQAEFQLLTQQWANNSWLRSDNRYRKSSIERIKADLGRRPSPGRAATPPTPGVRRHLRASQLREYVAASTVLHCMDAWSYLGRGLLSLLYGDIDVARHLAYYAELRAAMALLGTEGIAIFSSQHFAIDGKRRCIALTGPRTHEVVWEALENWSNEARSRDLLLNVVYAGGEPMKEWLKHFTAPAGSLVLLGKEWFKRWGLDLQRLSDDRESRNLVSYRPTALTSPRPANADDAVSFVRHIWEMCEPSLSMRFRTLDRYLLRQSLEFVFSAAHPHGRTRKQAGRLFTRQVEAMLHQLGPGDWSPAIWSQFLTFANEPDHPRILVEAQGAKEPHILGHERQVFSRAVLLLRAATGACEQMIQTVPGFTPQQIQFWWKPLGEERCLWEAGSPPTQFIDLWTDIQQAIDLIEAWQVTTGGTAASYWKLWRDQAASLAVLGTCERICLWGFGL
jgi:hypothetical protein